MEGVLTEVGSVPWRKPADQAYLDRNARTWRIWTLAYSVPFVVVGLGLLAFDWLTFPVAIIAFVQAWIIPELYAFRGASVVRQKGARHERSEPVAQGLLGDLLGHDARELQRATGLAEQRSAMGTWLVGEAGALLIPPGGRRVHCFCVRVTDTDLPPSDRIAHLLLALRTDEQGFATVANHAFCGAPWRVRRRMPVGMRPALDAVRR
ncbi:MAG: hypothetical protein ACR2HC_03400 [Thermoleophilaceae bacterium]